MQIGAINWRNTARDQRVMMAQKCETWASKTAQACIA